MTSLQILGSCYFGVEASEVAIEPEAFNIFKKKFGEAISISDDELAITPSKSGSDPDIISSVSKL